MPKKRAGVLKLSPFGDPLNVSFIGIHFLEKDKTINVYLRCRKHNSAVLLTEKLDRYDSRSIDLTDEQSHELVQLLFQSKQEQGVSKDFVVGNPKKPNMQNNIIQFRCKGIVLTDAKRITVAGMYGLHKIFSHLKPEHFNSFEDLRTKLEELIERLPNSYRLVKEINEDGYGKFS